MIDPVLTDDSDEPERISVFHRVIHVPLVVLHAMRDFVRAYLFSRPWMLLPVSLPAFLAAVLAIGAATWIAAVPDRQVVARIERGLREAIVAEDLASRRVCLMALMQQNPKSAYYRFQYALLLSDEGDKQSSQALLGRLASSGDTGYSPAICLLAEQLLTRYGEATRASEKAELRGEAIRYLEAAGDDRGPLLDYRLGMLYAEDGRLALAELQLRRAADADYVVAQMVLSHMMLGGGQEAEAAEYREQARESLEVYIAKHPNDLEARIAWAQSLVDGGQWEELTRVLSGLQHLEVDASVQNRLGSLYLAASKAQSLTSPSAARRAVDYAQHSFSLLQDQKLGAWRLIELAGYHQAIPVKTVHEVRDWLRQACEEQPDDTALWLLRAQLAELIKDLPDAERSLVRAVRTDPRAGRELTSFYRRQGNAEKLAVVGPQAVEYFESCLAENPRGPLTRILLANVYADLQRWEQARELVSAADGVPDMRSALAEICIREFDATISSVPRPSADGRETSESVASEQELLEQLLPLHDLLETALRSVPHYRPAIDRLERELLIEVAEGRDVLRRRLLDMLADGEQPVVIHKLLGVRASQAKEWPTAMQHLEQAYRLQPEDAVLLNNLAYALLSAEVPRIHMRRAESLTNEALQLVPDHPEILATRGAIRVKLKKYKDAAVDLERALEVLEGRAHLHQLLADCYDQLGLEPLAEVHREKAKQADSQTNGS